MKKSIFYIITFFILFAPLIQRVTMAEEEAGDIIVEKNLFSPERKKWEMPEKDKADKKSVKKKGDISEIQLFGTVIGLGDRHAVLRSKKGQKFKNRTYKVGDYIRGYCIKEIERKKVVLSDEREKEDFIIFLNEGKKDRTAVKTEIKDESPEVYQASGKVTKKKGKKDRIIRPKKAKTASFLKKRLNRHVKVLKNKKSSLVVKQAKKDLKKIQRLLPYMSVEDRREVSSLKKEIEKLGK